MDGPTEGAAMGHHGSPNAFANFAPHSSLLQIGFKAHFLGAPMFIAIAYNTNNETSDSNLP